MEAATRRLARQAHRDRVLVLEVDPEPHLVGPRIDDEGDALPLEESAASVGHGHDRPLLDRPLIGVAPIHGEGAEAQERGSLLRGALPPD